MNIKSWKILPLDKDEAFRLANKYGFSHIIAMLLSARGVKTEGEILELLGDNAPLETPFSLIDMDKAVVRIQKSIDEFEKIAVYGDYDADGITATAILYTYLQSVGADVMYYIPNREGEGYGMNVDAVKSLAELGVNLIVTVDNGVSCVKEVALATSLGIDVVITDHHRPQKELPEAVAVVDPHRADCGSAFKDFSGAGLALKLVMALEADMEDNDHILYTYADLAALGIIGDVVPLRGENRTMVKEGLARIIESEREGVIVLTEKCGLVNPTATSVAFTLVPRINATGRMGAPERAVELLITDFHEDALALAEEICNDNEERRAVESRICESAFEMIENSESLRFCRVLVIDGIDWHHGVLGIVASRIMERYGKPTIVISKSGAEAKGSGRSIEGFSLFQAVSACADVLTRYGGHPMAAGLTLNADRIAEFRARINDYAHGVCPLMPAQKIVIDFKLMPAALSPDIPQQMAVLEPFGSGNPSPIFGLFSVILQEISPVGNGGHLRLTFKRDGVVFTAMRFGCRPENFPYKVGAMLDLAVALDAKEYRGAMTLTVNIRDMKPSAVDSDEAVRTYHSYEKYKRLEPMGDAELKEITPTRSELADIYRAVRAEGGWKHSPLQLLIQLHNVNLGKLLIAMEIFKERQLITVSGEERMTVTLRPTDKKTDIFDSAVYKTLKSLKKEG